MSEHPELAILNNYLHNSAADEYAGLRLHLAQCSQCRDLVTGLSGVQQTTVYRTGVDALTDQQHQRIAEYIDGHLGEADNRLQKTFIESSAAAMKAALHYASHKSAMDKALLTEMAARTPAANANLVRRDQWFDVLKKLKVLFSLQAPIWMTVPATAALVAVLSFNVLQQADTEQGMYAIAGYQDNPVIQFRASEQLPGIGFFARPSQSSEPYKAIKIAITEGNRFTMQWPPVSGAVIYTLRLQMFNTGGKVVVGEVTTNNNSAVITANLDNLAHRYEWVLSGETSDNRVFISSGGFVVNHVDKGVVQ